SATARSSCSTWKRRSGSARESAARARSSFADGHSLESLPARRASARDRTPQSERGEKLRMNAKEVLEYAKKNNVKIVDLRFTDFPGQWQHCSYPISEVDEGVFEDGLGFDGSSIRGWQAINESDMLMIPDPATAFIDPFLDHPTLVLICNIEDPITRQPYSRDPRWIARKAETYLKSTGFGDVAYFGPEAERVVSSDARFSSGPDHGFYSIDSPEAAWNTGRDESGRNLPDKPR